MTRCLRSAAVLTVAWRVGVCVSGAAVPVAAAPQGRVPGASAVASPSLAWRIADEGRGQPTVAGHTVFFLTRHHQVVAVHSESGALLWRAPIGDPDTTTLAASLVVSDRYVIAGDEGLVAIDRRTGEPGWRFVPAIGYGLGLYLGDVSGGRIFAGSPAGRVYALSTSTGDLAWSAPVSDRPTVTAFAPVTDGGVVFVGYTVFDAPTRGGVVAFEATTGRHLWRFTFPISADPLLGTGSAGGPVLVSGAVVAAAGDGRVYVLEPSTGAVRTSIPAVARAHPLISGPMPLPPSSTSADFRPLAVAGATLLVGSLRGDVVAYDSGSWRERWRYFDESDGSVSLGLATDGRSVYVPFASGAQLALSVSTGARLWRAHPPDAGLIWRAAWDTARVYMAGRGGLFAFKK